MISKRHRSLIGLAAGIAVLGWVGPAAGAKAHSGEAELARPAVPCAWAGAAMVGAWASLALPA